MLLVENNTPAGWFCKLAGIISTHHPLITGLQALLTSRGQHKKKAPSGEGTPSRKPTNIY
jgi:hypothetical protein